MPRFQGTLAKQPRFGGSRPIESAFPEMPERDPTGRLWKPLSPSDPRYLEETLKQPYIPPPTTAGEKALGLGEIALQTGTGAAADIMAGISGGLATAAEGIEEGEKTVKGIQEAFTYEPRTRAAKEIMGNIAAGVAPIIQPVAEKYQGMTEAAAEAAGPKAGPYVGATIATLPTAIMEIMNLKGSRALKKTLTKRLLNKFSPKEMVDEAGQILPEVERAMMKADFDLDDMKEILPGAMETQAGEIGKTVSTRLGKGRRLERLAEQAQPNPQIVKAAEEFGLLDDMLTSHTTKDFTHAAVVQGLSSIPGSRMAARQERLLKRVAQRADALISEFGGTTDKLELSDAFRDRSRSVVKELEQAAGAEYDKIRKELAKQGGGSIPVKADNILKHIDDRIAELGGDEWLTPLEKKLYKGLQPGANPTYSRLDDIRKQIGESLSKGTGTEEFKNAPTGRLKKLYGELAKDQQAAAAEYGFGDLYKSANQLVATRKAIEDQLITTLGKDLTGNITTKAKKAILDLGKGDSKAWDNLAKNIPEELGRETRQEIFATALNDVFQGQSRKGRFTPAAFDDFMNKMKKNPESGIRLKKELGTKAYDRLINFHKVVGGIRRGLDKTLHTGKIMAVPGVVDDVQTIAQRLYGAVETGGKKLPILRHIFGGGVDIGPKIKRSITADELLDSPQFRNAVFQKALGKLDTPEKVTRLNKYIEKTKAFKSWATTLSADEAAELASVGILGYLMGEATGTRQPEKFGED